uniref:Uncharacterized protein n=1 Tax=Kalanchoe fedtschenkoi TaxID=63787 RepID=A0A7N1A1R1_KALFE
MLHFFTMLKCLSQTKKKWFAALLSGQCLLHPFRLSQMKRSNSSFFYVRDQDMRLMNSTSSTTRTRWKTY